MAVAQLTLPSMGRHFMLGSLYDTKTNEIVSGLKIWSRSEIEQMTQRQTNESMECTFVVDTSLSDKAKHFPAIDGKSSLSILCGAIQASGSGKYLSESKVTKETESVTYKLDVKTKFEELHIPENFKVTDIGKFHGATHVVTGIQYGGTALFTFERNKEESKAKDETSGGLRAEIGMLAFFSVSGSGSLKMTAEETKTMQKIKVTYKGDFHLASAPTNCADAIKCIQALNGSEARAPVTVMLTPLKLFTDDHLSEESIPLSELCIEKALICYETLHNAMTSLESALASLQSTPWSLVVLQLEESARHVRKLKVTLDEAVKERLGSCSRDRAVELDEIITHFDVKLLQPEMELWIDQVLEATNVLVAISERFRRMGVKIITNRGQKTSFLLEGAAETGTASTRPIIVQVSCPTNIFACKAVVRSPPSATESPVQAKLWENTDMEGRFCSSMAHLEQLMQNEAKIAVEQLEKDERGINMKGERCINGKWADYSF